MKHQFHFATFFSVALSLAISMNIMASCGKGASSSNEQASAPENSTEVATEQAAEETMKAPKVDPDANGLIRLSQCPTTYDKMEVAVTKENTEVAITYDGQQLQTFSDSEDGLIAAGDDAPIYFMDANFDGYVDIFIGPGESRTYSTLLTWDAAAKQFTRVGKLGNPTFQNIMLYPSEKYVFEGGSASWCSDFFTRSIWEGGQLKEVEELCIVTDAEQYGEYDVENKYTLKDSQQKVILSTDDVSKLPAPWKSVVDRYGSEEH